MLLAGQKLRKMPVAYYGVVTMWHLIRERDTVEIIIGDDLAFTRYVCAAAHMVTRAFDDIDYAGRNPVDTLQTMMVMYILTSPVQYYQLYLR